MGGGAGGGGGGGFRSLVSFFGIFLYAHFVKRLISRLSPKCFMMVTVQTHNSMCL